MGVLIWLEPNLGVRGNLVSDGGDVNCRDGGLVSSGITQIMVLSPISKVALHTTLQQQSKQSFSPQSNRQHCRPPLYIGHNTERIYTELVPPKDSMWLPCGGVNWKKEEVILMSAVNMTQWSSFITDSDAASSVGAYSELGESCPFQQIQSSLLLFLFSRTC